MKNVIPALGAAALLLVSVAPALAQTKTMTVTKVDNSTVRVVETTYPPGSVNPMVARPATVVYVVSGTEHVKFTYPDGHSRTVSLPAGSVFFTPAATRSITNVGTAPFTTLAIQIKK
jgi:hypothetical protein